MSIWMLLIPTSSLKKVSRHKFYGKVDYRKYSHKPKSIFHSLTEAVTDTVFNVQGPAHLSPPEL